MRRNIIIIIITIIIITLVYALTIGFKQCSKLQKKKQKRKIQNLVTNNRSTSPDQRKF